MRITFLGTGTSMGIPVIACDCSICLSTSEFDKRLRASVLIEDENQVILIDAGPDFRQQMLRAGVKKIDAVLLTHGHADHVGGLDDVRPINWQMQKPLALYAQLSVLDEIRMRYSYAFTDVKYPGVPEYRLEVVEDEVFYVDSTAILPIPIWHGALPVLGFRIGKMAYITDASKIDAPQLAKLHNLDLLVINGLRYEPHITHFSLPEALEVIEFLKPQRALITHISHQLGLHTEVNKTLPPHVSLAFDGMVVNI